MQLDHNRNATRKKLRAWICAFLRRPCRPVVYIAVVTVLALGALVANALPLRAKAAQTLTVTSMSEAPSAYGASRVSFFSTTQGTGGVAYCGQCVLFSPTVGQTLTLYGSPGIPELDYVMYHGWDGQTVTSLYGLDAGASRTATNIAVWYAIGTQRSDILTYTYAYGSYHGNRDYVDYYSECTNESVKSAAMRLYQEALAYKAAGAGGVEEGCAQLWLNSNKYYGSGSDYGYAAYQALVTAKKTASVGFVKKDSDTLGVAQGDATLKGAEYTVTDSNGDTHVGTTDADGRLVIKNIPLGKITVQETKAPEGYKLDSTIHTYTVTAEHLTNTGIFELEPEGDFKEEIIRGGVAVAKLDADTLSATNSGDCSFEGCVISVYNDSESSVEVNGTLYRPGEKVLDLKLGENGCAESGSNTLPYGSYYLKETAVNDTYLLNTDWKVSFSVRSAGKTVDTTTDAVANSPVHSDIEVQKRDLQNDSTTPEGVASFEGAEFTITNVSAGPVKVAGTLYNPGEDVLVIKTNEDGLASTKDADADGEAGSSVGSLPCGAYTVRETRAPLGYKLNTTWIKTVEVRKDGSVYELVDACGKMNEAGQRATSGVGNLVKRGDISFSKIDGTTNTRLSNVAFLICSETTGEAHVVVTDENGMVNTSSSWNGHETYTDDEGQTHTANANDGLLSEDGGAITDSSELDALSGVWFYGSNDNTDAKANDELGALPYDTYSVSELRCEGNEGYDLVSFTVRITRDGATLDLGTLDDGCPCLDSELTDEAGLQELEAKDTLTLIDTVDYGDVAKGSVYTIKTKLWDLTTGEFLKDASGEDVLVESTFSPTDTTGSVRQILEIDASSLTGHSLVAFDWIYGKDGSLLCEHADESDADQTVSFASIETYATSTDGGKDVPASSSATLVDRVTFSGLRAGAEYELVGTLHLVGADSEDEGVLTDADGAAISLTKTFKASSQSGSTSLEFEIDTSSLQGRSLVVFETLFRNGRQIATHADITDEGQTVTVPDIGTKATGEDELQTLRASDDATLTDTVSYTGLTPGLEYTLTGTLHLRAADGTDAGEVTDKSGSTVCSTVVFTPDDTAGEIDVLFSLDASSLQGCKLVVFESLSRAGICFATHADIEDEGQTVVVPEIKTTLTDVASGDHEVAATGVTTLTDTVSFSGLVPGRTYTLTGTLHLKGEDGTDAGVLTDEDGAGISSSIEFTPDAESGKVELSFSVDASLLQGKTLVAFEELKSDGLIWATHADIADADQTVVVSNTSTPAKPLAQTGNDMHILEIAATATVLVASSLLLAVLKQKQGRV